MAMQNTIKEIKHAWKIFNNFGYKQTKPNHFTNGSHKMIVNENTKTIESGTGNGFKFNSDEELVRAITHLDFESRGYGSVVIK